MIGRSYQNIAADGVFAQWQSHASTLVVMATGLGKTVLAAMVAKRIPRGRVMFLAHREELVWQAARTLGKVLEEEPQIEMAEHYAHQNALILPKCVVATVQSLNSGSGDGRLARFNPRDFGCLIIDESHHGTARSYVSVIEHFKKNPQLRIMGITATPDRADEMALGKIFDSVAYTYDIADGIADGWLTSIEVNTVVVDGLDLSSVRTTAGDLNGADLARVMEYEENLHRVAHPTYEIAKGRKTLVFAASVDQAERLAEILNRHRAGCAKFISGKTPKDERREILRDYKANRFQFLCNCAIATEGFDEPGIQVVAMARPTKSRSLYAQMIGRATRPLPGIVDLYDDAEDRRMAIAESGKTHAEIIDFVGNSGKHKLICAADILGGKFDDDVVQRAAAKIREKGMNADAAAALKEAQAELFAERQRAAEEEAGRRLQLRVNAQYSTSKEDPFDVLAIQPQRDMGWDTGRQITDKMRSLLEKQGIENVDELGYSAAKQIIGEIARRWNENQCSFKQAKLLAKHGLPTNATRDQAREWIDAIAQNGWKLPSSLEQHTQQVEVF